MAPKGMRPLPYRKVARALRAFGFRPVSQEGSHVKFRHPDGRFVIVPHHAREEIGRGLLQTIMAKAGVDAADFLAAAR